MGSQWTSKYAILRDLSFAQGRKVPGAIVGSVGVGQKPPAIRIKEETEEEFFQNCVGDGDMYTKPDLILIKEMLNMVRESDSADDNDTAKVVEISKLNPLSEEFVPKIKGASAEPKGDSNNFCNEEVDTNNDNVAIANHVNKECEVKPQKKRKDRNAALISLLEKEQSSLTHTLPTKENISPLINQTSQKNLETTNNMQSLEVKLLKPNDFIINTNITKSLEKVNEWLQKPAQPQLEQAKPINLSPKNMFKKKTPAPISLERTCTFKRKSDSNSVKSSDSDIVPKQSDNVFVPSIHAKEYYKKFVERHQEQEKIQEDIWKRAERLMKEIDAKRLKEKEQKIADTLEATTELNVNLEEDNNTTNGPRHSLPLDIPGLDIPSVRLSILLPQHRHDLPEECKVCLALAKYKREHSPSK